MHSTGPTPRFGNRGRLTRRGGPGRVDSTLTVQAFRRTRLLMGVHHFFWFIWEGVVVELAGR